MLANEERCSIRRVTWRRKVSLSESSPCYWRVRRVGVRRAAERKADLLLSVYASLVRKTLTVLPLAGREAECANCCRVVAAS